MTVACVGKGLADCTLVGIMNRMIEKKRSSLLSNSTLDLKLAISISFLSFVQRRNTYLAPDDSGILATRASSRNISILFVAPSTSKARRRQNQLFNFSGVLSKNAMLAKAKSFISFGP